MLGRIIKDVLKPHAGEPATPPPKRRVLNVGGGSKEISIPSHYATWDHLLLDVDPRGSPDILCDARELQRLPAAQFDAVFCSHNLEHYFRHDVLTVLRGFIHILKADGFAEIWVPDLQAVMTTAVEKRLDLSDTLYRSPSGPITVLDILYGHGSEIERTGHDYYAHKTGFTPTLLYDTLTATGFASVHVYFDAEAFEVRGFAFKAAPSEFHREMFGPDIA